MSPRTKEQFAEIREEKSHRISEAALSLFASRGYDATSISEIAKEAGVSKGLIYNYFASKESILRSIIDQVFDRIWDRFEFNDIQKVEKEDMVRFIEVSIDMVLEDLKHYQLYFAIFTQQNVMKLLMDDLMERSGPFIKMMLDYYTEKGIENPGVWLRYMSACIDGIQMHLMMDPDNFPVEEVKKIALKQFT